jgi:NCAIR mutase (PurE)-related protein
MDKDSLINLLNDVKNQKVSIENAVEQIKDLPFKNLDFVKLDHHRELRKGFGEVIYCKSKTIDQLQAICKELINNDRILYTRVGKKKAQMLLSIDKNLTYSEISKIAYKKNNKVTSKGSILIVAAGTSDISVAEEAALTAEVMGNNVEKHFDVGVAGIHRLFAIYDNMQKANVIIAVAGMEGALPSVISGLVNCPVIAVPTSVGYGSNFGGLSALLTMLNSCSPGIAVVNIDNGFGAGYLAAMINNRNQ